MTITLIALSDTHGGHTSALMNPDVELYAETKDGDYYEYTPESTKAQVYEWGLFNTNLSQAKDFAGDNEIILIHNGEPIWGVKHPDQLVSTRNADQVFIAVANLETAIEKLQPTAVRFTIGSAAHEISEGSATIHVTRELSYKFPDVDIKPLYHGLATIGGVEVDYAHHGPFPSSRIWLEGNNLRYYLRDAMMRSIMNGKKPPDLFLRAHFHTFSEETLSIHVGDDDITSQIVLTPSYMLMTDFARRVTRSASTVTNGLVVFDVDDGSITRWKRYTKTVDIRTKENLGKRDGKKLTTLKKLLKRD